MEKEGREKGCKEESLINFKADEIPLVHFFRSINSSNQR